MLMMRLHLSRGKAAPAPIQEKKHHPGKSYVLNYIMASKKSEFSDKTGMDPAKRMSPFSHKPEHKTLTPCSTTHTQLNHQGASTGSVPHTCPPQHSTFRWLSVR